jgi:nascent polypeptide-associated complex subunit alpha
MAIVKLSLYQVTVQYFLEVNSMHKRMNPREQKRMMQRMGMNMDSVADVQQVIIRTADKDIIIDEPEVAILQVQGQKMYQIIGGQVSEQAPSQRAASAVAAKPAFSEEDVQLVADQTGRSLEKAKEALQECGGDLAKAILLLQS